jgi:AraC-like DNA-binding protein
LIDLENVNEGHRRWCGESSLPRHRHHRAYAAVVLSGSYEESGTFGRHWARAGDVLLHRVFDAHLDRFSSGGARILNLLLDAEPAFALGGVSDPDSIARLAETDTRAAREALSGQLRPAVSRPADWPDLLARDLLQDSALRLEEWAQRHGLAAKTLSRGFRKVFDIPPATFRAELRARAAVALIVRGAVSRLAEVAAATGFADQAHMTRAIGRLTGRSPGHWLRSNDFNTAPTVLGAVRGREGDGACTAYARAQG